MGLDALKDPTFSLPLVIDSFRGVTELIDWFNNRNDPNVRQARNINIGNFNQLMNEAANGGMQTPYGTLSEYSRRQMTGQQDNIINPFMQSLGTIGTGKPGSFKMPDMSKVTGDLSMYDKPYQTTTERTIQATGKKPEMKPIGPSLGERARDWFVGLFENGTTSVPQTGLAVVHQGEAIIPAQQNPLAQPPGVQGQPLARNQMPSQQAGAPAIPPPPQPPQMPQVGIQPNQNLPSVGLNPQAIQMAQQRGNEQIQAQLQSQQRQAREQAAMQGNAFGGNLNAQMFEAQMGANQQQTNLARDLAIEAENRRFADAMAQAQFGLNQQTALGQLDLGRRELDLNRELGQGDLALRTRGQNQQYDLGTQELGLNRDRLGLDRYTAERQLGLQERGTALEEQLGRGRLGLDTRAQNLNEQLGRGQLDLQNRQFGLDSRLGLGQLGIQQQQANLQGELGRGQLDLDRSLGNRNASVQEQLARLQGELGRGQLGLDQQAQRFQQGTAFNEANRQFNVQQDLARQLGLGQLGIAGRGMDLQELIQQTDTEFGRYDRTNQLLQQILGRQDNMANTNTGANVAQEQYIRDIINGILGESSLPNPVGAGA